MKQILFVCLGNICRSPVAEAIMNEYIQRHGKGAEIRCDSAGILNYHAGEPADHRMRSHARKRGYRITSISRPIDPLKDFAQFDMIIGMDPQNIKDLKALAPTTKDKEKIFLMTDFLKNSIHDSVPDPYFGGEEGFELVIDILEQACKALLNSIPTEKHYRQF
jgi:protein-tyrosine phosphatase